MREIKFRVWVKPEYWNETENKGLMTNGLPLGGFDKWWLNLDVPFFDNYSLDGEFTVGEEIEIMQYTGLKDKNGLEIYEGDILKKGNGHKHIVKYNKGCFCLDVNVHLVEIIGNIYENPELLERSVKADA